jgi:hypothetical protein
MGLFVVETAAAAYSSRELGDSMLYTARA